jgi:ABC-type Zn2+ transport system substrate-binding protein/surface adhesin
MENENTQILAEKIARLLQSETQNADFYSLQANLEKINQRLDRIESQISVENSKFKIQDSKSFHTSQEKFTNLEELADEITQSSQMEKACPYEPTGKPCDHCAMCNSLGF